MASSEYLIKDHIEERLNSLLAHMTIEEKIGQMNQVHQFGEIGHDAIRKGEIGSVINAKGPLTGSGSSPSANAEHCNALQRIAIQESRLGIPIIYGRDVIHGYRTVFPIPLAQAAAWDPQLVERATSTAAREACTDGIKWTFSPMLDIARDPRWGRIAEGFGEDPYLASILAAAAVRGFQGEDMADGQKLVACAKHFAGYGAAEGGRDYEGVEISTRTMRDIYLKPFHAAVNAGVGTLMSAFHDLNGIPLSANRWLLTDVLRNEWGFKGFVVSDWNAVAELVNHGIAGDLSQAVAKALHAGVDMDMVSESYLHHLASNLEKQPPGELDEAVRRILRIKFLAGLFDQPYVDPERAKVDILTPENRALARRFAQESIILLKNTSNLLPLDGRYHRVAVVGPLVTAQGELFGTWTPDGRVEEATSIMDAFRQSAPANLELSFTDRADQALQYSRSADVAVVIVGEHPMRSGENNNVSSLELPPGQLELVEAIADQGTPIVLVVLAGRPLAINQANRLAAAVLYAWHPGIEGGFALADLIFGSANPCAKLPVTMPRVTGQVPIYYNHKNSGRPAGSGEFSVRYVDLPLGPLYPFGYGLSYTRFDYSDLKVTQPSFKSGTNQFSATITNQGPVAGTEIVQLYVRDLVGSVTRPVKELKGFQKITLQPGEARRVTFDLASGDLAFTGADETSVIEPGEYHVWIGPNSQEGLQGGFTLLG